MTGLAGRAGRDRKGLEAALHMAGDLAPGPGPRPARLKLSGCVVWVALAAKEVVLLEEVPLLGVFEVDEGDKEDDHETQVEVGGEDVSPVEVVDIQFGSGLPVEEGQGGSHQGGEA